MKYCEFCGRRLGYFETCACPDALAHPEVERKNKIKIIGFIAMGVAIILAAILGISAATAKIDPFDYVTVKFSGYNTIGSINVSFDKETIIKSIIGDEPEFSKEYFEWCESYEKYQGQIELTCSKEKNLSNGDSVTVKITTKLDAADKIESGEQTFTVQGLTELQTIDVFKDIDITFSGVDGEAEAELTRLVDEDLLWDCRFEVSKKSDLSSGEVITVSIKNVDRLIADYGILVSPSEKEYTVPTLDAYLTNPELLSKESIREYINLFLAENYHEPWIGFHYSDPEYIGTYFAVGLKEGYRIYNNFLLIVIRYEEFYGDDPYATHYALLEFPDLILSPDGTVNLTYDMRMSGGTVSDIDEYFETKQKSYSIVAIDPEWKPESSQEDAG